MSSFKANEIAEDIQARTNNDNGAALIMVLLVLSAFSLLTAAIVSIVQAEVKISANYKYGQQSFYVANAGVQKSLNWFNTAYTPHTPASDYNTTKVPVQYQNADVILAGQPGGTSNYPADSNNTPASFGAELASKCLAADLDCNNSKNKGQYAANATLIRTSQVRILNTSNFTLSVSSIERWRIDSVGFWGTSANSMGRSELSAVIENQGAPFWDKALWALTLASVGAGTVIDSYDPALGPYGGSNVGNLGNLGSNGDVSLNKSGYIAGNVLYGPTGTFSTTGIQNQVVSGTVSRLAAPRVFPPISSFSAGTTDFVVNDGVPHTLASGSYGTVKSSNHTDIVLAGGTYYLDQLQTSGNSNIVLTAGANTTLYIKSDLDLSGGTIINPNRDPTTLQVYYSGTTDAKLTGGGDFYGTVYAPNATLKLAGQSNFYGSFIANQIFVTGGAAVHFDAGLLQDFLTQRTYAIISWTQKTF